MICCWSLSLEVKDRIFALIVIVVINWTWREGHVVIHAMISHANFLSDTTTTVKIKDNDKEEYIVTMRMSEWILCIYIYLREWEIEKKRWRINADDTYRFEHVSCWGVHRTRSHGRATHAFVVGQCRLSVDVVTLISREDTVCVYVYRYNTTFIYSDCVYMCV